MAVLTITLSQDTIDRLENGLILLTTDRDFAAVPDLRTASWLTTQL